MNQLAATTARSAVAAVGVEKAFGGVAALRGVDLEILDGHALGLVGENGAGKSTLINVLTGALAPDRGSVTIDGRDVTFKTPHDALNRGIGTVHQQNWLVPGLTVTENLELGYESARTPLRILSRRPHAETLEALELVGLSARGRRAVSELSLADRQLVAVSRACARGTRLIIFDEPTAALTPAEADHLFGVIDRLRMTGRSVLYVTHRLEELARTVEQIVVMRAGEIVATTASSVHERELVELIAGEQMPEQERRTVDKRRAKTAAQRRGKAILVGEGLTDAHGAFRDVEISLRSGEVLAVVGLPDSGAIELIQALAGARRLNAGQLLLSGAPVTARDPRGAVRNRIGYLPGDRKRNGVIPNSSLRDTVTLSALSRVSRWGVVRSGRQRELAVELVASCEVRAASLELPITALSGGNQQKALFARTMASQPG